MSADELSGAAPPSVLSKMGCTGKPLAVWLGVTLGVRLGEGVLLGVPDGVGAWLPLVVGLPLCDVVPLGEPL